MNTVLRDERGGIVLLSALSAAVFLLLIGLVVDVGNWYTHKRQLQNKADAGALAAGFEYLSQLQACQTTPVPAANAISDVAKRYAGTGDPAVAGAKYNQTINATGNLTVRVNAASPTDNDWTDGANPCQAHATGDTYSPNNAVWTDVKVRETNVGTLFGGFGLDLLSVTAQARVEVKQILGIQGGGSLPLVNETGDQIECVWAQFVRARDGSTTQGFSVTPSNPILMTEGPNDTWTANITNLRFTNAHDDVAVRYWAGARDGTAPCSFTSPNVGPLPHEFGDYNDPQQIDWINVYDTGAAPGTNAPPKLRHFALTANTCGGPGFIYTASLLPLAECRVNFTAIVDTGVNNVRGEITVQPHGSGVDPVTASYDSTGAGSNEVPASGWITIHPNEVTGSTTVSQDYTQVGPTYFSVGWRQTTGQINGNCPGHSSCSNTFAGESAGGFANVQHQIYVADPLASAPMVGTTLGTPSKSYPGITGQTGTFPLTFRHTAVDKDHIVLLRDSVQASGNRTKVIYCGNGPGKGAAALENAFRDGCAKGLIVNQRQDSCSPAPGSSANPWDCVQLEQGNKTSVAKGMEDRFACTPNFWPTPKDGDQRWAYIILTDWGRTFAAGNNDWLPIAGLLKVYVTGWDKQGGGGGPANCAHNDDPPRGYDGHGAQLWGHLVSPVTLDPIVITGDPTCNLTLQNPQCKPALVR